MTQAPEPKSEPKDKAPETPLLNEKIADIALKAVTIGGVGVGGLGAFWSLFKDSDVPKAIASAVIGLAISYAAKLLQPIDEGNRKRLEKAGKAMDGSIDRTIEYLVAKAKGGTPEDRYLACQALECQAVRSDGVPQHEGIFRPLLEEVFVPLRLDASACLPGLSSSGLELSPDVELRIWDFLSRTQYQPTFRQLVILAWGGYGKTTLLKHIAYIYGTGQQSRYKAPKRIPVLLVLRQYRDLMDQEKPPSLPELIMIHHAPNLAGAVDLQMPPDWAKEILKRGDALIMLDGFDEVPKVQRPGVARWINEQMRQYAKSVFMVTSRPKAYREQEADRLELATPLWVHDFDAQQRGEFVQRWYRCQDRYANGGRDTPDVQKVATEQATELLNQIEARPELMDLAKNPLLLNLMVTLHRRYPGADLPQRRVDLYREICRLQLKDRPAARKLDTLLIHCDAQNILQLLALEMMQKREKSLEYAALRSQLAAHLRSQGETVEAGEFLTQVVDVSELLVEREPGEYEFSHLSFQEYLATAQIGSSSERLYKYFHDDWWKPTILFYVAAQKNPSPLIQEALKRGATDLAYQCLQQTTKQVDPALAEELRALKQAVQSERYHALVDFLKNGQWREADNETYRLMITTVGKEEGQGFDRADLENFPCEDLRTLDRLWAQYSYGKWGFSAQKRIWQECSIQMTYNWNDWKRFLVNVGWRKNENCLDQTQLTAHLEKSLYGEFPSWGCWASVGGIMGWVSLLSRTDL